MIFLFGMELNNYFTMSASTSVIVDKSSDGEFLRIDFNFSFPALSCEFAAVDVSDILGTIIQSPNPGILFGLVNRAEFTTPLTQIHTVESLVQTGRSMQEMLKISLPLELQGIAGFISEAIQGVGGIIELAPGYFLPYTAVLRK
ncbi:protein disulfide isomerase-like 5-4 [Camellia sinensis]|uniref:protein disulfide isomerase-like 5-4 n=1 Tax=Camellia sinensis TaxID=4442 RepID=UPI001035FC78|nr:protein disulfide isomerase-like 5-4 [Camellia sinensis]